MKENPMEYGAPSQEAADKFKEAEAAAKIVNKLRKSPIVYKDGEFFPNVSAFGIEQKEIDAQDLLYKEAKEYDNDRNTLIRIYSSVIEKIESTNNKTNKELALEIVSKEPLSLRELPNEIQDDIEVVARAAEGNIYVISDASKRIKEELNEGLDRKITRR